MAIKAVIEKLEDVAEGLRGEYEKGTDGKFYLKLEGEEDAQALKRARDHEKAERIRAQDEAKRLREEKEAAEREKIKQKGDLKALDDSWKAKFEQAEKERDDALKADAERRKNEKKKDTAERIAKEISTAPSLMMSAILPRLRIDEEDGVVTVRVLDVDGKLTAASVDDLKRELSTNKEFAPIILASRASGGGATSDQRTSGDLIGGAGGSSKKFTDMNDAERTEWFKRDPAGFRKATSESRAG